MREAPYLVAGLLIIALLLQLDFVYYVIYVIGGIWLLARWATPRSLRALGVRRAFVDHAFLGETIPVTVELATGRMRQYDYSGRDDPPILHRKERLLAADDDRAHAFLQLTQAEETAGLLDHTSVIGFRDA